MREFLSRSAWSWVDYVALYGTLIAVVAYMSGDFIGRVEGKFFPVVSNYHARPSPTLDGDSVTISGSFYLHRDNCAFRYLEWYVGGAQDLAPVGIEYGGGAVLSSGIHHFRDIRVNVGLDKVENLIGVSTYQCPWRPWLTRTQFFP